MKFDFTEGEWYYQSDADDYTHIVRVRNKKNEAYFLCQLSQNSSGESRANARLISCAPEMLKRIISYQDTYEVLKEIFEKQNPIIWDVINGAFIGTYNTPSIIEKATGKKLEDIINE